MISFLSYVKLTILFAIWLNDTLLKPTPLTVRASLIEDDKKVWNRFFQEQKDQHISIKLPGSYNYYNWDRFSDGFTPGFWDTAMFHSLILLPDRNQLWAHMWKVYEIQMTSRLGSSLNDATVTQLWIAYLDVNRDFFCCSDFSGSTAPRMIGCQAGSSNPVKCCDPTGARSKCNNLGSKYTMNWALNSTNGMLVRFFAWLCIKHAPTVTGKMRDEIKATCPDPCRKNPCIDIPNSAAGQIGHYACHSEPWPLGMYHREFTCKCRENYLFDKSAKRCLALSSCSTNPCYKNGTYNCEDTEHGNFRCLCRRGYIGSLCQTPANACLKRQGPESGSVTGSIACATADGNRCFPIRGTDVYRCDCVSPNIRLVGWKLLGEKFLGGKVANATMIPDNCAGVEKICQRISCSSANGGFCLPSSNGSLAVCSCNKTNSGYPLFEGDYCERAISQWESWQLWDDCQPPCGDSCFQSRYRVCHHKHGNRYCIGSDEQIIPCHNGCKPCPNITIYSSAGVYFANSDVFGKFLALATVFVLTGTVASCARFFLTKKFPQEG